MSLISRDYPREIIIKCDVNPNAFSSLIINFGKTKVNITASVEESVPPFLKGKGQGWIMAEYSMLPAATGERTRRERTAIGGRTQEIQRLIGRSLRAAVDMKKLGERSIIIDCDVLVADGGTRTASISGGFIALALAIKKLVQHGKIKENPIKEQIAAISVGVTKEGQVIADLDYQEDSSIGTDMNVVMTSREEFVEIQGTAEGAPFSAEALSALLNCARSALKVVFEKQKEVL